MCREGDWIKETTMLKFDPRFNDAILDGTKTQTVRLEQKAATGEIRACINPHPEHKFGTIFAWVKIIDARYRRLDEIDPGTEGFEYWTDLKEFLENTYTKEFDLSSIFYVIHFELTEAPNET